MRAMVILLASALAITPAIAADKSDQKQADPNQRIICKVDKSVGTMISGRICHTRAEWDQIAHDAKEDFQDRIKPAFIRKPVPGG